jgi:mRNA interferase MazF
VWNCALPNPIGPHPVVVLTANRLAEPLAAVTVAVVTGTAGPDTTHVPAGPESGLTRYAESFVNCGDLHTVAKSRLRRKIGLLAPTELKRVEDAIRLILGLRH